MNIWGKLPPWAKLIGIAAVGLAAILVPALWSFPLDVAVRDIGVAIFGASILAFTIDRWFKGEIARDVFFATLGYILPTEFKDEIGRVIGFKMVCEHHFMHVEITKVQDDPHTVRLTMTIERTLKNISSDPQPVRAYVHIDEWGFGEKSRIDMCQMEFPDGKIMKADYKKAYDWTLEEGTQEVMLRPGETVKVVTAFSEVRRINDQIVSAFRAPTKNPEMQIEVPPDMVCHGGFGSDAPVERLVKGRQILRGMYFPHAHMRLRWYPKEPPAPKS